jgi:hypothetical protein
MRSPYSFTYTPRFLYFVEVFVFNRVKDWFDERRFSEEFSRTAKGPSADNDSIPVKDNPMVLELGRTYAWHANDLP